MSVGIVEVIAGSADEQCCGKLCVANRRPAYPDLDHARLGKKMCHHVLNLCSGLRITLQS